ncbi:MAG: hypothetical protein AAFW84_30380 [Cyanobacteria bacterium J06635_15]
MQFYSFHKRIVMKNLNQISVKANKALFSSDLSEIVQATISGGETNLVPSYQKKHLANISHELITLEGS